MTITRVVIHIEPIINSNAFVRLLNVMVPQRRKIKHVTSVNSDFEDVRAVVIGIFFEIGGERVNGNPVDRNWLAKV